jgi:pSer/pThr/pTyr-binding forkhead associated (FHA) protein
LANLGELSQTHLLEGLYSEITYREKACMSSSLSKDLGLKEGQTYIISRKGPVFMDGHIYINSPTVSRPHAELKIKNGRVYLRNLDSTNGIYIVDDDGLVGFEEGYVKPCQLIVIGKVKCTIQSLIAVAGVYSDPENNTLDIDETQKIEIPTHKPVKKTETG